MTSNQISLADSMPLWHFDRELLVYSDGSLGVGFQIQGRDIVATTTESLNGFSQALENLLNTAPEGLRLQVFY